MSGFKKIGVGTNGVHSNVEQPEVQSSTGGFKRIEGFAGTDLPKSSSPTAALGLPKVNASRPDAKKELQEPTSQPQGGATNDVTKLQADVDAAKQAEADAWAAYNQYSNSVHWTQVDHAKLSELSDAAVAAQENRKKAETMLQTAKYGSEYAEKYGADTKLGANMMGIDKGIISIGKSIAATPGVIAQTSKAAYEEGSAESEDPEVVAAREKEAAAKRAVDNFVAMNMGSMDMPEKQAELAKLNEALTAATAERKTAESKHAVALDMTTKSMKAIQTAGALRDDATSDLSGFEKDLADAALSVGQNLPFMPVATIPVVGQGLALAGMSSVSAAQSMYDQGTQGKSAGDAFQHGVATGAIEAMTEKIPLDNLADMVKTGGKSFVVNLLKQAGIEAAEEGVSYTMNYILDEAENNPDAKFDWNEFWQSVKIGGLSGLFFGAGGTIVGSIKGGQTGTPSGNDQRPTAGVNLPGAPVNAGGMNVDTSGANLLPGAVEGDIGSNLNLLPGAIRPNQKFNIDNADPTLYNNAENGGAANGTQLHGTSGEGVRDDVFKSDSLVPGRWNLGSGDLRDVGVIRLSNHSQNILNERGVVDVELFDSSMDHAAFSSALDAARAADEKNGWAVSPQSASYLSEKAVKTYLSQDGTAGFGITRDGDIIGVFSNKAAGAPKGALRSMMPKAIAAGGTKLDCYGLRLVRLYEQYGFIPVATVDFSQEFANPGWTPEKGSPLVYVMLHNGDSADTVVEKMNTYTPMAEEELAALRHFEADKYYDAIDYRDKMISGSSKSVDSFGQNTVGAAQAQFPYQEAPSQSVADNLFTEQELQERDLRSKHQVFTNAEGRSIAAQMLANDYDGELQRLQTDEWGPVENVEGHMILEDLVEKARQSKSDADWAEVKKWKKLYDQKGGTDAAQTLQSRAQFANSSANIVADAVEFLDGPEARRLPRTRRAEVIDIVDQQATTYESVEEGDVDSLIKLIEQNNEIRRTTGLFSKRTAKQLDWALHEVANKYPDSAEKFLRDVAASQIRNISLDYKKIGATEAAKTIRIMNMLSKASTVMRNLVSNNVFDPLESLSGNVGIIADALMSKATGNRTTAVDKSWFSKAKRSGSLEAGLKSYIEVALDAPVDGAASRYEGVDGDRVFKMQGNFVERLLSTWSKYQSYALRTTDEFQKGGIAAETQRGIDKLTEQGKLGKGMLPGWAEETAKQRTFQNDSRLAKGLTGLRKVGNDVFSIGSIGAGDILLPFARVPGNLVSQAGNYSPLGLAKSFKEVVNVMVDAKKGNYDAQKQAQAARNFGRGVNGTALLGLFTTLALKGLIDVAGADDKDKEALEKAQGKTGTQWNLSATLRALNGKDTAWQDGDTLMSIGFLEPLNAIMAAGALIADDYEDDGHVNIVDVASSSLGALWQSVLDLPAMTSINDLINTYNYAEGETAGDKLANAGLEYAGSQASSFLLPNAIRGIATGLDDTVRNQYAGETIAEGVIDSFKSGLPGLRETLPASLDPFGRERTQTGNTALNMLNNNLLPGAITKYSETKVESTLADIYNSTGEAGIYPNKSAPSSVSINGAPYLLDPEQKDSYLRRAGQTAEDIMADMIGSKTFKKASDADKAAYLSLANQYARAIAAEKVTNGKYEIDGFVAKAKEAEKRGVSVSDFLMFYNNSKAYNEDGEGSMKITENAAAIQNSGLSSNEQLIMWGLYYPDWATKASEVGVAFSDLVQYKVITNNAGATKKDQKIAALQAAGYSYDQATALYNKLK